MASAACVPMLLLEMPSVACAVLCDDMAAIEADGQTTAAALDLDRALGITGDESDSRRALRFALERRAVSCRTRALFRIADIPSQRLFSLPRVLRDGRCAQWVRGFVVLDERDGGVFDHSIALWLDLLELARVSINGTAG